ncbi:MAG: carboxypeptidase M32, partial [Firmicutes bacterium]|nr:carboxypeptidase M32 [Bacillota bacterium]
MNIKDNIIEFKNWQKRLSAYRMALSLIGADQTFGAPSEGALFRSQRTAVLHGEYIKAFRDEKMYDIISSLDRLSEEELSENMAGSGYDAGDLKRELDLVLKQLDKEKAIPAEEYVEFSLILDRSKEGWLKAKKDEDYKSYAPLLQDVIDGYKRITSLQNSNLGLYDRMLDDHQPGWVQAKYDIFFNDVKERVLPLVRNRGSVDVQDFLTCKEFPAESQRKIMKKVCELIGFDQSWGRMGESEHPLTTFICKGDIRFTTKFRPYDPSQAILSTVHESGHAWFGHNVDPLYEGSIIGSSISAGFHESQSRLCENHLGRSRAFWEKIWPMFKEEFSEQLRDVSFD